MRYSIEVSIPKNELTLATDVLGMTEHKCRQQLGTGITKDLELVQDGTSEYIQHYKMTLEVYSSKTIEMLYEIIGRMPVDMRNSLEVQSIKRVLRHG